MLYLNNRVFKMWCRNCNIETKESICPICGAATIEDTPVEVLWCSNCRVPVLKELSQTDKDQRQLQNFQKCEIFTDHQMKHHADQRQQVPSCNAGPAFCRCRVHQRKDGEKEKHKVREMLGICNGNVFL